MKTFSALSLACLVACGGTQPARETQDATDVDAPTSTPCPTDEIAFSQADGCMNDGSVEICLPKGDVDALAAVRVIAPGATCMEGSAGRARCETSHETLCLIPTVDAACVAPHGAMTDATWAQVCAIAARTDVTRVVATFYE